MTMTRIATIVCGLLVAVSASAAPRIFVASSGTDTGACPRTAPCRTFAYAITQASSGSEIVALDTAGYGPVMIPFGVSIYAAPGEVASVTATGGVDGIVIVAGPNDAVSLRNLVIISDGSQNGIRFDIGANLTVEDTTFTHVFNGISAFRVSDATAMLVSVHNCRFMNTNFGIYARSDTGSADLDVKGCDFANVIDTAVYVQDHAFATVTNSRFAGDGLALAAQPVTTGQNIPVVADVERCTFINNRQTFYVVDSGIVRVGHSIIANNASVVTASGGGQVLSRLEGSSLTNTLEGNGDATTFTGTFSGK